MYEAASFPPAYDMTIDYLLKVIFETRICSLWRWFRSLYGPRGEDNRVSDRFDRGREIILMPPRVSVR